MWMIWQEELEVYRMQLKDTADQSTTVGLSEYNPCFDQKRTKSQAKQEEISFSFMGRTRTSKILFAGFNIFIFSTLSFQQNLFVLFICSLALAMHD